jgi:hypothetical protein
VASALADSPPFRAVRRIPWNSEATLDSEEGHVKEGRWSLLRQRLRSARSEERWVSVLCDAFHTKSLHDVKACFKLLPVLIALVYRVFFLRDWPVLQILYGPDTCATEVFAKLDLLRYGERKDASSVHMDFPLVVCGFVFKHC